MKKQFVLLAFLATVLSGCTPILRPFHRLAGTWQRTSKGGFAYESWQIKEQNLMLGKGFEVSGTDTIVLEELRIFAENSTIIYEATVPGQNDGKPVRFPLQKLSSEKPEYFFENPGHDFPQRIVYEFIGQDSLHVHVVDLSDKGLDFRFRKVK